MNKLFKVYDFIIESTMSVFFAVMIILIFAEVISRYFFDFPIMWSEEIGRYLFIWIVYLGAAQAFILRRHLTVDFLVQKLRYPYKEYLELTLNFVIIVFLFFVFLYGLQYAMMNLDKPAYSFKYIRLGWAYASIPIGFVFMIFNIIRIIPVILKNKSEE